MVRFPEFHIQMPVGICTLDWYSIIIIRRAFKLAEHCLYACLDVVDDGFIVDVSITRCVLGWRSVDENELDHAALGLSSCGAVEHDPIWPPKTEARCQPEPHGADPTRLGTSARVSRQSLLEACYCARHRETNKFVTELVLKLELPVSFGEIRRGCLVSELDSQIHLDFGDASLVDVGRHDLGGVEPVGETERFNNQSRDDLHPVGLLF